jgi:hypothetical protein
MPFSRTVAGQTYQFADLKALLARQLLIAPGDTLAGPVAASGKKRAAARMTLADLPLRTPREWLSNLLVPLLRDSSQTAIRPATLPKLDNGVEFQVVSMVNHLRYFASREGQYGALLFSLCLMLSPQLLKGMQSCLVFN